MDPITTALLAALAKLGEPAVRDAYEGLKAAIVRKFGSKPALAEAIAGAEAKPESAGRREVLREELSEADVASDAELVAQAQALLEALKAHPAGQQSIHQVVHGNGNMFSGTGNVLVNPKPNPGEPTR